MVEEAIFEGESLLIFSQFKEVCDCLERYFKQRSCYYNTYYIHGGTNRIKREQMITEFQQVEILATGESLSDGQPLNSASAQRLRQQFGVNPNKFLVLLVGKDGTIKHRSRTPLSLETLFSVVDAMPMRRQEMRSQP